MGSPEELVHLDEGSIADCSQLFAEGRFTAGAGAYDIDALGCSVVNMASLHGVQFWRRRLFLERSKRVGCRFCLPEHVYNLRIFAHECLESARITLTILGRFVVIRIVRG